MRALWSLWWLLGGMLLLSGCSNESYKQEAALEQISIQLAQRADDAGYSLISTDELSVMMTSKEPFLLVDVRTADSFSNGHIPGAVNFTFPKDVVMNDGWDADLMGGRSKEDFIQFLGDKGRVLVFSCGRMRCKRAHDGAMWAVRLGFHNVFLHPGGIDAWRGKNLPIQK